MLKCSKTGRRQCFGKRGGLERAGATRRQALVGENRCWASKRGMREPEGGKWALDGVQKSKCNKNIFFSIVRTCLWG